jgi:hypothetical protein
MELVMDSSTTEQIWTLYCQHIEHLDSDARKARQAFGFKGAELIKVPRLTRPEFEKYLLDPQWEQETRAKWLTRIIEAERDEEKRNALKSALGLEPASSSVKRPRFLQRQDVCREPLLE